MLFYEICPPSLPNPPDYTTPPTFTLRQKLQAFQFAVAEYKKSWDSDALEEESKRQQKREQDENWQRQQAALMSISMGVLQVPAAHSVTA